MFAPVRPAIAIAMLAGVLCGNAQAFDADNPARILYIGDSLAANTAAEVVAWTQGRSPSVVTTYSAFPGMAICDFLEGGPAEMDAPDRLAARIAKTRPDLVILQFWGNAFTKCMAGLEFNSPQYFFRYFADADAAVRAIEINAAELGMPRPRLLWVLQGPDPNVPERTALLNDIYTWIAAVRGDRTTDAGRTLSQAAASQTPDEAARDLWAQYLPCTDAERGTAYCTHPEKDGGVTQLHRDDDSIHFCLGNHEYYFKCDVPSPAIRRYGMHIAHDAMRWLGLP